MKHYRLILGLLFAFCLMATRTNAQCSAGTDSVCIVIQTSNKGYEAYWQLVKGISACGTNVIFAGGNTQQINCNGANANVATPGHGYANYDSVVEGPWCLNTDSVYSIQYIDDAGASDNEFTVMINGFPVYHFHTIYNLHTFTFTIDPPLPYNVGMRTINTLSYVNPGNVDIKGTLFNYSSNTINSLDMNYRIDGGNVVTQHVSNLAIAPFVNYDFVHPVTWNPTYGDYTLEVWISNLNGNADMDQSNDTLAKAIVVGDPIPNIVDNYLNAAPVFTVIGDSNDSLHNPSDLDFHTILSRHELWVLNMGDTISDGSTVTFYHAGEANQYSLWRLDDYAHHFMFRPTAIAFSDNTNFATTAAVLDAHHLLGHFAGPTLWSSDPLIYAQHFPGLLGSHIDMLHQSPFSMGITEEHENAFWVYDGYNQRITHYDFERDHGPGHDTHEDGRIRRYDDIVLNRINDTIPNHLVLDHATGWLYVVDNGNARVVRMNINTGSITGSFTPYGEPIAEHSIVTGTTWSNYITSGIILPSGIDLIANRLLVSDYSNGDIIIFNNSGANAVELGRIHTGAPGVAGIKIGPDGKIWYVNMLQQKVYRIDGISDVQEQSITENYLYIYPNPANDHLFVMIDKTSTQTNQFYTVKMINAVGQVVFEELIKGSNKLLIDTHQLPDGIYILSVADDEGVKTRKVIVNH